MNIFVSENFVTLSYLKFGILETPRYSKGIFQRFELRIFLSNIAERFNYLSSSFEGG